MVTLAIDAQDAPLFRDDAVPYPTNEPLVGLLPLEPGCVGVPRATRT